MENSPESDVPAVACTPFSLAFIEALRSESPLLKHAHSALTQLDHAREALASGSSIIHLAAAHDSGKAADCFQSAFLAASERDKTCLPGALELDLVNRHNAAAGTDVPPANAISALDRFALSVPSHSPAIRNAASRCAPLQPYGFTPLPGFIGIVDGIHLMPWRVGTGASGIRARHAEPAPALSAPEAFVAGLPDRLERAAAAAGPGIQPGAPLYPLGFFIKMVLPKDVRGDLIRFIDRARASLRLALIRLRTGLAQRQAVPSLTLVVLAAARRYGRRSDEDDHFLPVFPPKSVSRGELVMAR